MSEVKDVRIGRYLEIELEDTGANSEARLHQICRDLLSNPRDRGLPSGRGDAAEMKFAVVQFPGSNCDQDCLAALRGIDGLQADYVWHKEKSLRGYDAIVLPGGFPYGDYLRCGAIARFSPIMTAVAEEARAGRLVIGSCNGFQIHCEAGLLPGALCAIARCALCAVRSRCGSKLRIRRLPRLPGGSLLRLPVAHGEGCFFADEGTLREMNKRRQVLLRYTDSEGRAIPDANPNGSIDNIAGVCNRGENVFLG